jgi:hypothetical protein
MLCQCIFVILLPLFLLLLPLHPIPAFLSAHTRNTAANSTRQTTSGKAPIPNIHARAGGREGAIAPEHEEHALYCNGGVTVRNGGSTSLVMTSDVACMHCNPLPSSAYFPPSAPADAAHATYGQNVFPVLQSSTSRLFRRDSWWAAFNVRTLVRCSRKKHADMLHLYLTPFPQASAAAARALGQARDGQRCTRAMAHMCSCIMSSYDPRRETEPRAKTEKLKAILTIWGT